MPTLKQYMTAVEKKLNDPAVKMLLQFGQTYSNKVTPIRDAAGMEMTRLSIMQTAENAFNYLDGQVALGHMIKNFSTAGHSDVSKVETVGAIDLTILAMSQSLVPFICVDRGLATPTSTIYFNNLVSNSPNGVGGVEKTGGIVSGNFVPPNTNVDLSNSTTGSGTGEIDLGKDIIPGTVKITVVEGDYTFTGMDFTKDGQIFFNSVTDDKGTTHNVTTSASVKYETGIVTINGTGATSVQADAQVDTKDTDGAGVLTVIPEWVPVTLETQPLNIVLQNNIANMMFMQKTYATATGSTTSPYNDILFQRVKNTYIEAVNSLVLKQLINSTSSENELLVDIASYGASTGFAQTKNDLVCQLISNMKATMLGRTGCPLTALIVNSNAAAIFEQIPIQFVANPSINLGINGLIGYFNGIPVFRHNALDYKIGSNYAPKSDGMVFGIYRNADNTSGSQVFGEFIPFTSTGNVSNFHMPIQNSTGYFSQVGSKVIQKELVVRGRIKLTTEGLFTSFYQDKEEDQ